MHYLKSPNLKIIRNIIYMKQFVFLIYIIILFSLTSCYQSRKLQVFPARVLFRKISRTIIHLELSICFERLTDCFFRCSDTSEAQYFEDDMFTAPAWLGVGMGIVSLLLLSPAIFKEHNITADLNRRMTQAAKGIDFIQSEKNSNGIVIARKD